MAERVLKGTILLGGYYGFGNLGDEAILFALLRGLREALPQIEPVVLSAEPARTAAAYGVEAINRWSLLGIWRELGRARLFLLGGGGLLQDVTSRRSALYYLGLLQLARLRRVPVFLLGQGIGPLRSRLLRRLAASELKRAEYVMVRDELSLKLLQEWGADRGQLARGYDLALTLLPELASGAGQQGGPHRGGSRGAPQGTILQGGPRSGGSRGTTLNLLLVSLREPRPIRLRRGAPRGPDRAHFIAELAAALDEAHQRFGLRPVFLPLHPREDLRLVEDLRRAMAREGVVLDPEGLPLPELLELVGEAKLLLGMRLHALEFALLAGVPFAAISYDPKVEEFVQAVEGLSGLKIPLLRVTEVTGARVFGALEGLWTHQEGYREQLLVAAAELGRLADSKLKEAYAKLAESLEKQPKRRRR